MAIDATEEYGTAEDALRRIFANDLVAAWLCSPTENDLKSSIFSLDESLVVGISIPDTEVSIKMMYTPLARVGNFILGSAYCHGTPNWTCKVVDSIVKLGHGRRDYERVSRFVVNLENGWEWYTATWLKDGRSIIAEKHLGSRGICGNYVYYCDETPRGQPPTKILSSGAYSHDCYFCAEIGKVCSCSTTFRYRLFAPDAVRHSTWGDFLSNQGKYGNFRTPLTARVYGKDGEQFHDGWLMTNSQQRRYSGTAEKLLIQERYLHELGFFNMTVDVSPFLSTFASSQQTLPILDSNTDSSAALLPGSPSLNDSEDTEPGCVLLKANEELAASKRKRNVHVHPCGLCGQIFKQRVHLTAHVSSVHKGLRPHDCSRCSRSFATIGNLNRHERNVHGKVRRFICNICNHAFSERSDHSRHVLKKHPEVS